ncbi:autophagocytosis protein [Gilbertella persicaria]|uniref:autophagocytosis protein n=1 Tax=Gilbertella persicaria TaxID=101096 RepID=UPI00221F7209|nr:autophagocytosis protein [Gilbertella persicaria]KAI8090281.1 autophagocytosis protein [Gilbertella persicaria]
MSVQDAYNKMFSNFQRVRDYLAPVLKNSKFKETGCITPEEFVAAGEFLVYKCPTWHWEAGLDNKKRDYLPSDKQFLVTRNVPCIRRARQMEYTEDDSETQIKDEIDDGEDWMFTHSTRVTKTMEEIAQNIMTEEEEEAEIKKGLEKLNVEDIPDLDDMPDIDDIPDMDDQVQEEEDPSVVPRDSNDKVLQVRTYDVFITYDKYYQTPRIWLFGYDEERRPLTSAQVFEDVSPDYVKKTVTIETHPHLSLSLASIHPCKHAEVMKKIIERMGDGQPAGVDEEGGIRVDQYLVIFLKFMSSVIPTIDYDHTISA